MLNNAIEIGRRLKEAKDLIPYGEWGKWLAESVSYTERTTQKLMLVFDAYGNKQSAALNAGAQTQRLPNIRWPPIKSLFYIRTWTKLSRKWLKANQNKAFTVKDFGEMQR